MLLSRDRSPSPFHQFPSHWADHSSIRTFTEATQKRNWKSSLQLSSHPKRDQKVCLEMGKKDQLFTIVYDCTYEEKMNCEGFT